MRVGDDEHAISDFKYSSGNRYLQDCPSPPPQGRIKRLEEPLEALPRLMGRLVGVAQPLHRRDGDGTIERAWPQGKTVAHVVEADIARYLALNSHVKHGRGDIEPNPHLALRRKSGGCDSKCANGLVLESGLSRHHFYEA